MTSLFQILLMILDIAKVFSAQELSLIHDPEMTEPN